MVWTGSEPAPNLHRRPPRRWRRIRLLQIAMAAFALYTAVLTFPLLALTVVHSELEAEVAERERTAPPTGDPTSAATLAQLERSTATLRQERQVQDAEIQRLTNSLKKAEAAKTAADRLHDQWIQWLKTADRKQIDAYLTKLRSKPNNAANEGGL